MRIHVEVRGAVARVHFRSFGPYLAAQSYTFSGTTKGSR